MRGGLLFLFGGAGQWPKSANRRLLLGDSSVLLEEVSPRFSKSVAKMGNAM